MDHFNNQILDKYVESGTKCKICRYHDANLNQLTRHVALQHEKIREFIPSADGEALFTINKQLKSTDTKKTKTADMSVEIELSNKITNEQKQSNKTSSTQNYACHICSKTVKNRSDLRQHVYSHLRNEIQSKYYPDNRVETCLECDYKSSLPEHVLVHMALKHQKILGMYYVCYLCTGSSITESSKVYVRFFHREILLLFH